MNRPTRKRLLLIALLLLPALAWAAWFVPVNLLLRGPLPDLVAKAGPRVSLRYDSAWTVWPNRIHVRGLRFAIEDRAVRLYIASPRASLSLSTDPSVWTERRVGLRDVDADDVVLRLLMLQPAGTLTPSELASRPVVPPWEDEYPLATRDKLTADMPETDLIWGVDLRGVTGSFSEVHVETNKLEGDLAVQGEFIYRFLDRLEFDVAVAGDADARLGDLHLPDVSIDGRAGLPLRLLPTEETAELEGRATLRSNAPFAVGSPLGPVTVSSATTSLRLDDAGWRGPIDAVFQLAPRLGGSPMRGSIGATAGGDRANGSLNDVLIRLRGTYDLGGEVDDEIEDRQETLNDAKEELAEERAEYDEKLARLDRREARIRRRQADDPEELAEELAELAEDRAEERRDWEEERREIAEERDEELAEDDEELREEISEREQRRWSMRVRSPVLRWGRFGDIAIDGPLRIRADRGTPLLRRVLPEDTPTPWARLFHLKDLDAAMQIAWRDGALALSDLSASSEGVEAWGALRSSGGAPTGEIRLIAGPLGLLLDIDGSRPKAVRAIPRPPRALRD